MRNHSQFGDGPYDYQLPPYTKEKEVLLLIDDIYVDLKYVKEDVSDLEDLLSEILKDRVGKKPIINDPLSVK